jgi:hypothetical protein
MLPGLVLLVRSRQTDDADDECYKPFFDDIIVIVQLWWVQSFCFEYVIPLSKLTVELLDQQLNSGTVSSPLLQALAGSIL